MAKTGELGADFGPLGELELGSTQVLGDVVENTSGLILLYKCDDPAAQATLAEKFGKDATVNLGTTAYTAGVDSPVDSGITTPSATPATPTKDAAPHLSFDYTGADINIGTAGTIEMWFRPDEFGDPLSVSPSIPALDYEILKLEQTGGSSATIVFKAGITNPSGAPIIRCQFTPTAGSGTLLSDAFATAPLSTDGPTNPSYPAAETGRWYYMVFTWNTSVAEAYCNGKLVSRNFGSSHPPSITTGNLHFGNCGGTYDSVAIINRKMTSAEVSGRFSAGQAALPSPGARMTSFFAHYAATYVTNLRVTQARLEVLRNGAHSARVTQQWLAVLRDSGRAARVTNQFIEVLRAVTDLSIDRTLEQTLSFTQSATYELGTTNVIERSVNQTLTFTETVFRTHELTVNQTLSFTETVDTDLWHTVTQTLTLTQTVDYQMVRDRTILQTLALNQTVGLIREFSIDVSQTLVLTETVDKSRVITREILQVLDIIQSEVSYATHEGVDLLEFTQTVTVSMVRSVSVSQTLAFTQSVSAGFIRNLSHTDTLTFSEFVMGNPYLIDAPRDSFLADSELGDLILGEIDGVENSGVDLLEFNETVGLQRIFYRSVTQTLEFTDSAFRGPIIWDRRITQVLTFYESDIPTDLQLSTSGDPQEYSKPVAIITKVSRIVLLSSRYQTIVLPTPEFNDIERLGHQIDVKRSMSGKVYTYVKTADWNTLVYDFTLTRRKALELRIFVERNLSEVLTLQNWKGQIYKGQFTNNPVTFQTTGRYGGSYEKVAVTLEIEGVRIHG